MARDDATTVPREERVGSGSGPKAWPMLPSSVNSGMGRIDWEAAMENELLEILTSLAGERVRFLVVGGVAVVLQGHPRFTADLDLLDLDSDNALKGA